MISWLTGSRINNVVEDVQNSAFYDASELNHPQTPAPVFAVRAFKHAIFGTPRPEDDKTEISIPETQPARQPLSPMKLDSSKPRDLKPFEDVDIPESPTKNLNSILITPGAGPTRRKTVSFGGDVKDNESRRTGKSGLPANCPGKFPSPWAPRNGTPAPKKTTPIETAEELRATELQPSPKPRAKDDTDITLDMNEPRSESGRFWKDQYFSYAEKSEKEMLKLATKQKLAKSYAKKKDDEAIQLTNRLVDEKRKSKEREEELDRQVKDYKERLRKQLAENHSLKAEMAALRLKLETIETKSITSNASNSANTAKLAKIERRDTGASKESQRTAERRHPPVVRAHRNPSPAIPQRRSSSAAPLVRNSTSVSEIDHTHRSIALERSQSLAGTTKPYDSLSRFPSSSPKKAREKSLRGRSKTESKENVPPTRTVIPSPSAMEPGPPYFGGMGFSFGNESKDASKLQTASKARSTTMTSSVTIRGTGGRVSQDLDMEADRKAAAQERIRKRKEAKQKDSMKLR